MVPKRKYWRMFGIQARCQTGRLSTKSGGGEFAFEGMAPCRGRVSNFCGLPATRDHGGLPTDSDTCLRSLFGGFPEKPAVRTGAWEHCRICRQQSRGASRSSAMLVDAARPQRSDCLQHRFSSGNLARAQLYTCPEVVAIAAPGREAVCRLWQSKRCRRTS